MNLYEKLKRFGDIISELAGLYGEMTEELPQLYFTGADAPVKSELKKTRTARFYTFRAQRRKKTTTLLCKNRQSD